MVDFPAASKDSRRPAKIIKFGGQTEYGKTPKVFVDDDTTKMVYRIHNFASLQEKEDKWITTDAIEGCGHLWAIHIFPKGLKDVFIGLKYADEIDETDTVTAKAMFRTKTTSTEFSKFDFGKGAKKHRGFHLLFKRKDIIEKECDDAGTFTITVEIQVATEKRSIWFPQLTFCDVNIGTELYNCIETSDITFIVGASKKEIVGHKCILFRRARILYDLVETEEESASSLSKNIRIVLEDVDETSFEVFLQYIYMGKVPTFNNNEDENEEESAKLILIMADRFSCTELKLYIESILIEKFLITSTAASLLLSADSHSCALLKELSMDMYASSSKEVMESNNIEWTKLKESNDLLVELLVYATTARCRKYSQFVDNNGIQDTLEDVDEFDVTSLRERLQNFDLDVDGSRAMLVKRWKDYLRTTVAAATAAATSDVTN